MDADSWQRLESIFFAVLELPPDKRNSYLDRACASDAQLRAEVDAVLAAHIANGEPDRLTSTNGQARSEASFEGVRIGAYRLEQLIGRGGMGEVYRAQRVDEQYRQEVAVKLVRSGPGTAELIRRFRMERQILAHLQHPNIATLLDGGITPDGQPYLVMQYVRGVPITAYADAQKLTLLARLKLFQTVCAAVQYAHANLVVHRDLKPSNILVTEEGQVRLLDFGIAKLLDPGGAAMSDAQTVDGILFTPEHAAPEQLQRKPVTTATDVYALGVLLYELLTGVRPFRASSPHELYRAVCEREPARPSVALATPSRSSAEGSSSRQPRRVRMAARLPGDLDHIVLMALRKEPARRYASAGQFAEDIGRFLEGRPVLARPDAMAYRVRKFIRRNRAVASLATVAAASLIGGLVATTWQASRARSEAVQAASDRDRAEHVSALLVDMFRLADPSSTRGQTVTAREVLDQGAARIIQDLAEQPGAQADLLTEIGQIYENLGLFEEAGEHLEHALELRRGVHGLDDPQVARSLTRLAHLRTEQGRAGDAVELAQSATSILRRHSSDQSELALADALLVLGGALRLTAASADAPSVYAEAASILERAANPADVRITRAFFGWADAAHSNGQFDLADSLLEQSVLRHQRMGGRPHPDMAATLNDLGVLRTYRRRPAEAEPLLRQALAMRTQIYGRFHPAVAQTLIAHAQSLAILGRSGDAVAEATEAVTVSDSVWGEDHINSVDARLALGSILLNLDQGERAVQIMQQANAVLRRDSPISARVVGTEVMIGQAYSSLGQFDRAHAHFAATLRLSDLQLGPEHPYRAHILYELARLDYDAGRLDAAEARATESISLTRKVLRPDHRFALWGTMVAAQVHAARGQLLVADSLLRFVLEAQQTTIGEAHPETALTLVRLADIESRLGRLEDAEAHARTALSVFEANHERGPALADARSVLGGALAAQARAAEAEPLLRGALHDLERARGARKSQIEAAAARLSMITVDSRCLGITSRRTDSQDQARAHAKRTTTYGSV